MERTVLTNGQSMPMLGLGTWKAPKHVTGPAVAAAVKAGYRLIDCANDYGNEDDIGQALAELFAQGVVTREEMFIQAKLWNTNHRAEHVRADLMATLADLQLTYLDSFVIHWPQACPSSGKAASVRTNGPVPGPAADNTMFPVEDSGLYSTDNSSHYLETWKAMEQLYDEGLVKSIGLSNFNTTQIREILDHARIAPTVLQNECHPFLQQKDLLDICTSSGIVFQAYSPLGSKDRPWGKAGDREVLEDPIIKKIASVHGKSPAQVVLRWHLQRGISTVPKSANPGRIRENIDILDFSLTDVDMTAMASLNCGWRHCLWPETSLHPDYPFKDELPYGYTPGPAPKTTSISRDNQ